MSPPFIPLPSAGTSPCAKAQDKQEIAAVEGELAMLAAQLAAIRRLRKK
jgi:hypothetical protein